MIRLNGLRRMFRRVGLRRGMRQRHALQRSLPTSAGFGQKALFCSEAGESKLTVFETRESLAEGIKAAILDSEAVQEGLDDPFGAATGKTEVLKAGIALTGIEIPSKDLTSITDEESLIEYFWVELNARVEAEAALNKPVDLPNNLSIG